MTDTASSQVLVPSGEEITASPRLRSSALWASLDQVLFGLSNLILNLLLARWLAAADYGAFGAALALLFLVGNLEGALLIEPMLVQGPKLRDRFASYLRVLLGVQLRISLAAAALVVAVGLALRAAGQLELGLAFLGAAAALPGVLAAWLLRRASYACFATRSAALVGGVQLAAVLAGAVWLHAQGWLAPASALLLLGGASAGAALALAWMLGVRPGTAVEPAFRRRVLADHWRYGRWMLAGSPFEWIPGNFYYLALPSLAGLAAAGSLRAMMNFVLPMAQLQSALRFLVVPALVRHGESEGFTSIVRKAGVAFVAPAFVYYAALLVAGPTVASVLYGDAYADGTALLAVLGLIPVLTGVSHVAGSILRARQRGDCELWSYLAASLVAVAIGVPWMLRSGAMGAAATYVVAYAVLTGARLYFVGRSGGWRRIHHG